MSRSELVLMMHFGQCHYENHILVLSNDLQLQGEKMYIIYIYIFFLQIEKRIQTRMRRDSHTKANVPLSLVKI